MKEAVGGALLPLSEAIFGIMNAIPMWAVRAGIFTLLALLALWVVSLPPQVPVKDEGRKKYLFRDLRMFALTVLVLQAVLYIVF